MPNALAHTPAMDLLLEPRLNKSTAFAEAERERLGLTGLLPDVVESEDIQLKRELSQLLDENAVLPLWPETGKILNLGRGSTYAAAQSGHIKTVPFGRLKKVPTAWLRSILDLNKPAA
jgi:malate dehydrogenase (oxaloacetate-decarboxylating)(NADP+)